MHSKTTEPDLQHLLKLQLDATSDKQYNALHHLHSCVIGPKLCCSVPAMVLFGWNA